MPKTALQDKLVATGGHSGEFSGVETIASFGDSAAELGQMEKILAIFDKYIIMDDVEVTNVSDKLTAIGIVGPKSLEILKNAGFNLPALKPGEVVDLDWQNLGLSVAKGLGDWGESFEIWIHPDNAPRLWDALTSAGARPVGFQALEWLRMLNGVPRYGIDMTERYLPQETGQDRALHFSKGCYLGQEIVERIRSRAQLHRTLAGYDVQGPAPAVGEAVMSGEKKIGEITSAAEIPVNGAKKTIALGYIRIEANTPGNQVRVGQADAKVASLPFQV